MNEPAKRLGVVGMGRSGTSFLAKFLSKCGVHVGSEVSADKCEHPRGRHINDSILATDFGARDGLPYGVLPPGEIVVDPRWRAPMREFVNFMDEGARSSRSRYWAFKDPRTTVLHDLWLPEFNVVVGIFRRPEQVLESYTAKKWISGFSRARTTLDYWLRFNQSLLHIAAAARPDRPMYIIDFNEDLQGQLERLCERLSITLSDDARRVFDTKQVHFSGVRTQEDARVRQTYNALLQACNLKR